MGSVCSCVEQFSDGSGPSWVQACERACWGFLGGLYPEFCPLCREPVVRRGGCRVHRLPRAATGPRCTRCAARLPSWFGGVSAGGGMSADGVRGAGQAEKQENGWLCRRCRRKPPRLARVHVAGDYRAGSRPLRAWCLRFKHGRRADLVGELGPLLADGWLRARAADAWPADGLVPVPLHWTRRLRRGYDQADLLAREVSRESGIPVLRCLRRTRRTATQGALGSGTRRSNVAGAFALVPKARRDIAGRDLWLVDDVATSLATAEACAQVLRANGARTISLLALARAEFRGRPAGGPTG